MADDTGIVLTIFGFYTLLTVLLGLVGGSMLGSELTQTDDEPSVLGIFDLIELFFGGIAYTISGMPVWANTILFLPLGITVMYIVGKAIIDLVPG